MRSRLLAAGMALAFSLICVESQAQTWPTKPVKIVSPFGAGSANDALARVLAHELSLAVGQPVVVENRAGADGAIGATTVQRSPPDGYTLLNGSNSPLSVVPHIRKEPPYNALTDFTPITFLGENTFYIVAHPSVPAKSLAELIAHAKAEPGKLNYATGNTFSIVSTAMVMTRNGLSVEHVPYKTEPDAIIDILSGRIQFMIASATTVAGHVKDGKLRALATTLPERSPMLPDVPSFVEAGQPKLPIGPWAALVGPAGVPPEIVERINQVVAAVVAKPHVQAELISKHGFSVKSSTPAELAQFLKDQLAIWKDALDVAGIKPQ